LILTKNNAALRLANTIKSLKNALVIYGSNFPQDLEYSQVRKQLHHVTRGENEFLGLPDMSKHQSDQGVHGHWTTGDFVELGEFVRKSL